MQTTFTATEFMIFFIVACFLLFIIFIGLAWLVRKEGKEIKKYKKDDSLSLSEFDWRNFKNHN